MILRKVALALTVLLIPSGLVAQERSETHKKAILDMPFEITLPANPSTGYQWTIDTAASSGLSLMAVADLGTSPPPSKNGKPVIGAPVTHSWLVSPQQLGTARLVLVWHRPRENKPPEKIHVFDIEIGN